MTTEDSKEFAQLMLVLGEVFHEPVSNARIEAYYTALQDYPIEAVKAAAKQLSKQAEFFPKPAHFVQIVEGSAEDRAAQAWGLLVEALRKFSANASLEITDDPAFCYALEQVFGSWIRAGDTLPDAADPMHASLRKQFLQFYRAYGNSGRQISLPKHIAGRDEAQNGDWANWRPGTELPPQPAYVLSAGQWRQVALVLNRQAGKFELVRPQPQLPPAGSGPRRITGGGDDPTGH